MIEIEKPRIERVESGESYGKFVVEPLEHGFGQTLGNSLRRVLLSSLPGVAVSSIRIEGIQHEFSAVNGVKEDVAEIILNLKELSAKLYCDGPKTVSINVKGPCELTAAALEVDDQIEIVNRDLHIATLNEDADLVMHLTLEKGRGYVSADKNKNPNMPIGVIPTDSIFTPIRKVNYTVVDTRVGQITDYDKLTLEIWTNGTVMPDEAISLAAQDGIPAVLKESPAGKAFQRIARRIRGEQVEIEPIREKGFWARLFGRKPVYKEVKHAENS